MSEIDETIYLDAVLTPNRSLTQRGFLVVMAIIAGTSFLTGLAFLPLGAVPVIGFFALDALAFWLALRWSFRQQRQETRIVITSRQINMHHRGADGREVRASVPSAFARVELDDPTHADSFLRIEHGRKAYVIGRFLNVEERKSLARALRDALIDARRERYQN